MHLTVSHMILDIATPTVSTTGILEDRRKIMVLLPRLRFMHCPSRLHAFCLSTCL